MKYVCLGYFDEKRSCRQDGRSRGRSVPGLHACAEEFRPPGYVRHLDLHENCAVEEIECLHHFADNEGNQVEPAQQGLLREMPAEVRIRVSFKVAGDNKTEITVTEFDWPVGQMMEMSRTGMKQCLDKMAAA